MRFASFVKSKTLFTGHTNNKAQKISNGNFGSPFFYHSEGAFGRGRIPTAISSKYSRSVFPEIDYLFSDLDTFENGYFSAQAS
ncbi:MAG TPA: hypothetical protein VFD29_02965 [Gillisia sp.]|nr:hypothetical protein [Gillisia sp.]